MGSSYICQILYIYIYILQRINWRHFELLISWMCFVYFWFCWLSSNLESARHCLCKKQHHDVIRSYRNLETKISQCLGINLYLALFNHAVLSCSKFYLALILLFDETYWTGLRLGATCSPVATPWLTESFLAAKIETDPARLPVSAVGRVYIISQRHVFRLSPTWRASTYLQRCALQSYCLRSRNTRLIQRSICNTELCTMSHKQENPVLAIRKFLRPYHPNIWSPNSQDCNPFDYYVWGTIVQETNKKYKDNVSIYQFKQVDCWKGFQEIPKSSEGRGWTQWWILWINLTYRILRCFHVNIQREMRGCPRGVMVKVMDYGIVVSEFVLRSRYYVHFRANNLGKCMNPLILPAMG